MIENKEKRYLSAKFVKFLKQNRCYNEFCANLKKQRGLTIKENLDKFHPRVYIFSSFDWSFTQEGSKYWNKINTYWMSHLKAKYKSVYYGD